MHVESDERLYWRARTYDVRGLGWSNSPLVVSERRGLEDIAGNSYTGCAECIRNVTFELKAPASTVFTAATPLRTTLPVEPNSNLDIDEAIGWSSWKARTFCSQPAHTVQSYVPQVTVEDISTLTPEYDDWVERGICSCGKPSPRVRNLAETLTESADTPYIKAITIREYLRTLEYSQNINARHRAPTAWIISSSGSRRDTVNTSAPP